MTSPLQQKIKITGPSVITANRTRDGIVIWRTDKSWSDNLADAKIVDSSDDARKLLAEAVADDLGAVGAYIAPVRLDGGRVVPGNLREEIRVKGTSFPLPLSA
ncbi:MAG: DUF2849 domain-containing protein [Afipia sp.]|nr:DUF2849 domain-containing protein [Afipia sp.]